MVAFTRCATTDSPNATSADGKIVVVGTANLVIGVARLTADGQLDAPKVTQYAWDQSYIDTPVVRVHDANTADGAAFNATTGDSVLYYTTDANHNITALVNTAGQVVERYAYDAYGKVTIFNSDFSQQRTASAFLNEILYSGYRQDRETAITAAGLLLPANYQVRNREYSVLLSNWTSRDPMGYAAGDMNVYRYCGNRATDATDPMGLWEFVRKGKSRAQVCGTEKDNVIELANAIRLDAGQYKKWLKVEDGGAFPNETFEPLGTVRRFSIPNRFVVAMGDLKIFLDNYAQLAASQIVQAAKDTGFDVDVIDHETTRMSAKVLDAFRNADVWGYAFVGHGLKNLWDRNDPLNGAFVWDKANLDTITAQNWQRERISRFRGITFSDFVPGEVLARAAGGRFVRSYQVAIDTSSILDAW